MYRIKPKTQRTYSFAYLNQCQYLMNINMQNVTYPFLEIRIRHKYVYLYVLYCSFSVLCSNSNCLSEIIKKAELSPIPEKNWSSTSFRQSFRNFSF